MGRARLDISGLGRILHTVPWLDFRRGPGSWYRKLASLRFLAGRDRAQVVRFILASDLRLSWVERVALVRAYVNITNHVRAYHTQAELLIVTEEILRKGCPGGLTVVEAGAGKGASTAKLSLAVRAAGGGTLHVFDSFRGLPENEEVHFHHDGRAVRFRRGAFTGRLGSVRRTVERFGAPEVCVYHRGWFQETMPKLEARIDVALLDVDLWSSTRDCLVHLFPRLKPDGVIFSQDGHLRSITERLADPGFWRVEVRTDPPEIRGLGRTKLLRIGAHGPAYPGLLQSPPNTRRDITFVPAGSDEGSPS